MDVSRSAGRSPSPANRSSSLVPSSSADLSSAGRTICTQTDGAYSSNSALNSYNGKDHLKSSDGKSLHQSARPEDALIRGFHSAGVSSVSGAGQLCYPQPRAAVWQPADPFGLNVCSSRGAPSMAAGDKWQQSAAAAAAAGSLVWAQPLSYAVDAIRQPSLAAPPAGMRDWRAGDALVKDTNNGHARGLTGAGKEWNQFSPPQSSASGVKSDWRRSSSSASASSGGRLSQTSSNKMSAYDGSGGSAAAGQMEQSDMLSPSAMAILEQPVCSMVVEGGSDSGGSPSSYPEIGGSRSGGGGGGEQWRCDDCGRVLSCAASLRRHRAVHSGVRPHVCNQCGRAFTTQAYLNGHMRSHTGEKPFMCPICARCFTRSTGLTRHMELHVSNKLGSGNGQSPAVSSAGGSGGAGGSAGGSNNRHHHHQQQQQQHGGQQHHHAGHHHAGAGGHHQHHHGAHQQHHAAHQQQQSVGVPTVGGAFTLTCGGGTGGAGGGGGSGGLTEMVPVAPLLATVSTPSMGPPSAGSNSSSVGRGRHQCPICSKMFTRQLSVKVHMRIHTGERPHKCQQCDKTFKNASHMRVHMRTHTNERRYPCGVCGKRFTESSSLRRHMRIHTGERPYECEFCGKEMRYLNHMKSHRRKHTGETPYQCTICGQLFRHQQTYRLHIRKHNGELPTCDMCGKSFSNRARMDEHIRLAHSMPDDPNRPVDPSVAAVVNETAAAGSTAKARHFLDMMRQHAGDDCVSPEVSAQGLDFRCRSDGDGAKSSDSKTSSSNQVGVDFGAHPAPVVSMSYPLMGRVLPPPPRPHPSLVGAAQPPPPAQHSPRLVVGSSGGYHPHSSPQQQAHTNSTMCQSLSTP